MDTLEIMRGNSLANVIKFISKTQDGKHLNEGDFFSDIILSLIDKNTTLFKDDPKFGFVNVENLSCDINYLIDQLKKANKPLSEYLENRPD